MEPEEPQGSLHVLWCPNFNNNTLWSYIRDIYIIPYISGWGYTTGSNLSKSFTGHSVLGNVVTRNEQKQ